jgi:hypothetical protein
MTSSPDFFILIDRKSTDPLTAFNHFTIIDTGRAASIAVFRIALMTNLFSIASDAPIDIVLIAFVIYMITVGLPLYIYKFLTHRLTDNEKIILFVFQYIFFGIEIVYTILLLISSYGNVYPYRGNLRILEAATLSQAVNFAWVWTPKFLRFVKVKF